MSKLDQQKEKSAMDHLFDGLVNPDAAPEKAPGRPGRKPSGKTGKADSVHMTSLVDVELLGKVRYIANKESLTIREILEASLRHTVGKYEEKNGTIPVRRPKNRKGDVDDILGL